MPSCVTHVSDPRTEVDITAVKEETSDSGNESVSVGQVTYSEESSDEERGYENIMLEIGVKKLKRVSMEFKDATRTVHGPSESSGGNAFLIEELNDNLSDSNVQEIKEERNKLNGERETIDDNPSLNEQKCSSRSRKTSEVKDTDVKIEDFVDSQALSEERLCPEEPDTCTAKDEGFSDVISKLATICKLLNRSDFTLEDNPDLCRLIRMGSKSFEVYRTSQQDELPENADDSKVATFAQQKAQFFEQLNLQNGVPEKIGIVAFALSEDTPSASNMSLTEEGISDVNFALDLLAVVNYIT